MPFMRQFGVRGVLPLLAALVLLAVAAGWNQGPDPVFAASTGGGAGQGGPSCPLTPQQELNSIKSFLKMMPVFRHPRCSNCHGGIPQPIPSRGQPSIRHAGVVDLDSTDNNRTCEECHVTDWGSRAPVWKDRTDLDLCRGMHILFGGSAARFIDHILRDSGDPPGFIKLAFEGKRGLLDGGQTIYETETGQKLTAAPPPGTHAQLVQLARDWVQAQGGAFVGDEDCGCVLDKLEVQFRSRMHIANHGPGKEIATITGEGRAVLKLAPDVSEPEWDATTSAFPGTGSITWSGVTVTRQGGCVITVTPAPPAAFDFWMGATFKPDLKLSLAIVPGPEMHGGLKRCTDPVTGLTTTYQDSIPHIFAAAWTALHGGPGALPMQGLSIPKAGAAPAGALDLTAIMAMDPKAIQAMAEALKNNPTPAGMAQLSQLMNQAVPGADKMAADARTNFKFAIPDQSRCTLQTGTGYLALCSISQTITVPDNKGSTQTITETTTISIGRPTVAKP